MYLSVHPFFCVNTGETPRAKLDAELALCRNVFPCYHSPFYKDTWTLLHIHQAEQEGWSTKPSLVIVEGAIALIQSNFRSHKDSPDEGSIWQKIPHIFPWFLGHGIHSEGILDGEAAWNKNFEKSKKLYLLYQGSP